MIKVSFFQDNGRTYKVRAIGHSGYAESGSDIVCAAVSTLVQTAYLAIKDLGANVEFKRDEDRALFEFRIERETDIDHDIQVIIRALRVGAEDLRSGYPQFITTETITGGK
ncbi:MAG: ribosomal-processing cysteine protease Prp [Clostridiales bacterium]|nr:ribosomal-processing cysteine protease Prp [Clostridiales bacterium]